MFRSSFGKERGLLPCYDWRKTHRIILSLRRHPQAWSIYLNDKMAIRTSTCFRSSSHTGAEMRFQDTMSISKKISAWSRHTDLDIPLLSTGQTGPGSLKGESTIQNQQTRSLSMHVPNDNAIRPHWLDFFGLPFNGTPPSLNSRSSTLYRAIQQDSSRLATDPSKKGISRRLLSRLSAEELRLITDLAADASRRSYDAGAYGVLKDWGKVLTSLGVLYVVSHAAPSVGRMVGLG